MSLPSAIRIAGALLSLLPVSTVATADTLRIISDPSGATLEIDGVIVGTTPYESQVSLDPDPKPELRIV